MSTNKYRELFVQSGVIVEGHFVYASGRHGKVYVNKSAALISASHAIDFAEGIAFHFSAHNTVAVVGPELGAVSLMADVRRVLYDVRTRLNDDIVGVIAEKVRDKNGKYTGEYIIGRNQEQRIRGMRTLIVEDILTTGSSARETVEAVRRAGGQPVAVAALWNRGGVTASDLGCQELFVLIDEPVESWPEGECPLCKEGAPVNTNLGKGAEFLSR